MKDPVSTVIRLVVVNAVCFFVAVGLGWIWMATEGFGCAVGDPPFENGCAGVNFGAIWLKATLTVLAAIYAIWILAALIRRSKGSSHGHIPL